MGVLLPDFAIRWKQNQVAKQPHRHDPTHMYKMPTALFLQVPYGIGVAASIIVGHRLGAGDKLGAITANNVCMAIIGKLHWLISPQEIPI